MADCCNQYKFWADLQNFNPTKHKYSRLNLLNNIIIGHTHITLPIQHSFLAQGVVLTTSGGSTPIFKQRASATLHVLSWALIRRGMCIN